MTVLKGIPSILPPELIYALAKMGHGDEIVLADANFPSASVAAGTPGGVIRCDGLGIVELLEAILELMPLDCVAPPCYVMELMPEHKDAGWETPIWRTYQSAIVRATGKWDVREVERMAFYKQAKKAFVVVATGERELYANLILKKGILDKYGAEL